MNTPAGQLLAAVRRGDIKAVRKALKDKAEANSNNGEGLLTAVKHGHTDIVKLLLENNADSGVMFNSPIKIAAEKGHLEILKILILNNKNKEEAKNIAIEQAGEKNQKEVVNYLLTTIEIGKISKYRECKALCSIGETERAIPYLSNEEVMRSTAKDNILLQRAAQNGHIETTQMLLQATNPQPKDINQAMNLAAQNGQVHTTLLLLNTPGCDVNHKEDIALRWAAAVGEMETTKLLLAHGAKPNARNNLAIRESYEEGHIETTKLLIRSLDPQSLKKLLNSNNSDPIRKLAEEEILKRHNKTLNRLKKEESEIPI